MGKENFLEDESASAILCPMIDARRMEVYVQQFSEQVESLNTITAQIITEESFERELDNGKLIFFGDGASKCKKRSSIT